MSRDHAPTGHAGRAATEGELRQWAAAAVGGEITLWQPISGGNRCRSWAVDVNGLDGSSRTLYLRYQPPRPPSAEPYTVWREASFYRALAGQPVRAPALIAIHPEVQAILTERAPGRSELRHLKDDTLKAEISRDFVQSIANLHRIPLESTGIAPPGQGRIADCIRQELAIWQAMYEETGIRDPLIDFVMCWLAMNVPDPSDPPVLVHGDAGPGNFLYLDGRMTALVDWELAHVGDPMEDLAWFCMRCVMEPVPDFPKRLAEYEAAAGRSIDRARLLYHRIFVSARIVILRHRNVTGEAGNSIVSRALNRRLVLVALASATRHRIEMGPTLVAPETDLTPLFDGVLDDLRLGIAGKSSEPGVIATAKNISKVLKFLREKDRYADVAARARAADLAELRAVANAPETGEDGFPRPRDLEDLPFDVLLRFFARDAAREAQLAAPSSGSIAWRGFPPLAEAERDIE
nr:phosphotransferase family protein [Chelatococcus asaccharovorans]